MPTAVSDWLPSFFSSEHMSPLMLVLLVMFFPEMPICLLCILEVKTLPAGGSLVGTRVKRKRQKKVFLDITFAAEFNDLVEGLQMIRI